MNHTRKIQQIEREIEEIEKGIETLNMFRLGGKTKPIYVLEAEIRRLKRNL